VGGLGNRGVVSTASYEARKFGVHSAMPMVTARRLCPQGIFLTPDHDKYSEVSQQIMEILSNFSPLVEPLSLDEAFIDVSGMDWLFSGPVEIAGMIKQRIREELHLSASAGVAPNKFLAKMASDLQKPDGLVVVEYGKEAEFLRELPVGKLWGVGETTANALQERGVLTIGQLARLPKDSLSGFFGRNAQTIHELSMGKDDRPVVPDREAKSVGAEETFEADLRELDEIYTALMQLAERVGYRLRMHHIAGRTVALKLRYGSFRTLTRQHRLAEPTQTDAVIYRSAVELLSELQDINTGVRLLGITVSQLEPVRPVSLSLFDEQEEKGRRISGAMDRMRLKFGANALIHGRLTPKKERNDSES
jgi:DNA polymerase IV